MPIKPFALVLLFLRCSKRQIALDRFASLFNVVQDKLRRDTRIKAPKATAMKTYL